MGQPEIQIIRLRRQPRIVASRTLLTARVIQVFETSEQRLGRQPAVPTPKGRELKVELESHLPDARTAGIVADIAERSTAGEVAIH